MKHCAFERTGIDRPARNNPDGGGAELNFQGAKAGV